MQLQQAYRSEKFLDPTNDSERDGHWQELRTEYDALPEAEQLPFICILVKEAEDEAPDHLAGIDVICYIVDCLGLDATVYRTLLSFQQTLY